MNIRHTVIPFALLALVACGNQGNKNIVQDEAATQPAIVTPLFNADSAYAFVKAQVDFGPRVPNTAAHTACGEYLAQALELHGAQVYSQTAEVPAYDGQLLKMRNIIGAYKPDTKRRIALFAHWDSRPWADNDPDEKNHQKPVPGANDGASGVGVLLEVARQIQAREPNVGVDIILLDAEDYGARQDYKGEHKEEYWCLGSQYWARQPHVNGYSARFGILLDMVGGSNATFKYEWTSEQYAKNINQKVWYAAAALGYGNFFVKERGGSVTDDHVFINKYARIPTIDIIATGEQYSFFEHWHTVRDDMEAISKNTLKAVGQTLLYIIYNER